MSNTLKKSGSALLCTTVITAALIANAQAAGQRHADAHLHGEGSVNFAIDGADIHLELDIPASDILGYESISSRQQRHELHEALEKLEHASLWQFTGKAECKLVSAHASAGAEHYEKHHEDEGHHDHHKSEKHDDHDDHHDDDEHHDDHESEHMDITASYHYRCQKPALVQSLKTTLFDRFENSKALEIQGLTARGTVAVELNRKKSEVTF